MPNTDLQKYIDHNRTLHVAEAAKALGISAPSVYRFIKEEGLERISKGVYAYPDTWLDEMKLLSERSNLAVFSHESALLLHNLTDREPPALTVTVPSDYNAGHFVKDGVRVFYVKPKLLTLGKTEMPSPEGNLVPCYDLERTMCDIVRSRSQVDTQIVLSALKAYVKRKDKRLDTLSDYAKKLRITKLISQYLEVLL